MDIQPNGAGFRPEIEDVPTQFDIDQAIEDGECFYCGGEIINEVCTDCNEPQLI